MKRFWASWYTGNYEEEGCTKPPFKFWLTGQVDRPNYGMTEEQFKHYQTIQEENEADEFLDEHAKDDCTLCAVIDAENDDDLWKLVAKHFPDYRYRFCEQKEADFQPGSRFQ